MKEATEPLKVLQGVFGYQSFRRPQNEIIQDVIDGHDVMVIMPTGGGKSLCYQIPALILDGLTIVISPLIALMDDQVLALRQLNIKAATLHAQISYEDKRNVYEQLNKGSLDLLYLSPESALTDRFLNYAKTSLNVKLIAVDEAHCISVWGNDFRPEYVRLNLLKEHFENVPLIALTATADEATRKDIVEKLGIIDARQYISSFERKNIIITAEPGQNRIDRIVRFLQEHPDESGIIYTLSRKSSEQLAQKLTNRGWRSEAYHAGLLAQQRSDVQLRFRDDKTKIVCATIAFGMGIDKSNVRFVIHYNLPKNIESFYQEIGRAGRDGEPAHTLLFYSWSDMIQLKRFIDESDMHQTFKEVQNAKLTRLWEFANSPFCRSNMILNYFGEYRHTQCGHCDNCIEPPQQFDGTVIAQKALSAIFRAKEQLNQSGIIDYLKGNYKADITKRGLDQTKTFGAGRDLTYIQWKVYINQLISRGLVSVDYTDYYKLKLTPLSIPVLQKEVIVQLYESQKNKPKPKLVEKTKSQLIEEELFKLLKTWRLNKARELAVPAYVILSDRSLSQIASSKPQSNKELRLVEGIGDVKLERFGSYILEIVQEYIANQTHSSRYKGKTKLETLALYRKGLSATEIAELREINIATIYDHLIALYEQGEAIDLKSDIDHTTYDHISNKWIELGKPEQLNPIYKALKEKYDYSKIKIVIALAKKEI